MEKHENVYRSRKRIIFDNFLGGISWALGVWVGTTIIIALLVYFVSKIDFVPIVGQFVSKVTEYVARTNSPFHF